MTTEAVLVATVAALLAWEVWTFRNRRPHDTISEVVQRTNRRWPIVAVLLGILIGHFFWPLCDAVECEAVCEELEAQETR